MSELCPCLSLNPSTADPLRGLVEWQEIVYLNIDCVFRGVSIVMSGSRSECTVPLSVQGGWAEPWFLHVARRSFEAIYLPYRTILKTTSYLKGKHLFEYDSPQIRKLDSLNRHLFIYFLHRKPDRCLFQYFTPPRMPVLGFQCTRAQMFVQELKTKKARRTVVW